MDKNEQLIKELEELLSSYPELTYEEVMEILKAVYSNDEEKE